MRYPTKNTTYRAPDFQAAIVPHRAPANASQRPRRSPPLPTQRPAVPASTARVATQFWAWRSARLEKRVRKLSHILGDGPGGDALRQALLSKHPREVYALERWHLTCIARRVVNAAIRESRPMPRGVAPLFDEIQRLEPAIRACQDRIGRTTMLARLYALVDQIDALIGIAPRERRTA
jgi:hypothetical protein